MGNYDFARDIYEELTKWSKTNKGLLLKGKEEASTEKTSVLPLHNVHMLGAWLGHSPGKNKYTSAIMDLFLGSSDEPEASL